MTNFEKFKKELTVERLVDTVMDADSGGACEFCIYDNYTCESDCEYGIKKWLESEVE